MEESITRGWTVAHWYESSIDRQIREAQERGEFDDLPGAGKPLEGLGTDPDPDWWVKRLVEREQISVLPPALELRKEDAELELRLDRITAESEVREELEGFNARVRRARMQLLGGPPVITPERDVETDLGQAFGNEAGHVPLVSGRVLAADGDEIGEFAHHARGIGLTGHGQALHCEAAIGAQ